MSPSTVPLLIHRAIRPGSDYGVGAHGGGKNGLIDVVVVIEMCYGCVDKNSTTRTGIDRSGAIMAMRMSCVDSFRGCDHMIVITLIHGRA